MHRHQPSPLLLGLALLMAGCASAPQIEAPEENLQLPPGPLRVLSGDSIRVQLKLPSYDGHLIPMTLHRPVEAAAERPVPVILHSHGWAGTRTTTPDAFRDYHQAGFAVVSIDMRGHGEARPSSTARVHHMDYEIKDVRETVSHLAGLDWVLQEAPGDPVVGAIGGSYGGAYQLLAAATDPRFDALAPDMTWHDLAHSLVPNKAPKSAWADVLYSGGTLNARLDPTIHEGFAIIHGQNRLPDGQRPGEPDLATQFRHSSPASYPSTLRAPTFLTQGVNDTLFNLNEAVHNFQLITEAGGQARLVTHLGGHILNTQGSVAAPMPRPVGLQSPAAGSPCMNLRNATIAWHQVHLLGMRLDLGPRVCLVLEDSTYIQSDQYPPPYDGERSFPIAQRLQLNQNDPTSNATARILDAEGGDRILAGIPILRGKVTTSGPDTITYASLLAGRGTTLRVMNAQVVPQRWDGAQAETSFELEMGGVGARLKPGESLHLRLSTHDPQFAHNAGRGPSLITFSDLQVELPLVKQG